MRQVNAMLRKFERWILSGILSEGVLGDVGKETLFF